MRDAASYECSRWNLDHRALINHDQRHWRLIVPVGHEIPVSCRWFRDLMSEREIDHSSDAHLLAHEVNSDRRRGPPPGETYCAEADSHNSDQPFTGESSRSLARACA